MPALDVSLPPVTVVAAAPLPGSTLPLRELPFNVQLIGGRDLERPGAATLADQLAVQAASVGLSGAQGNAFQPELTFRGFTASPLMGTPQGVSVFFDGVRLNEAFGDVVNWDLIPSAAIGSVQVMPGSNPVFGLNTLGGALVLLPASGRDRPGTRVELEGGSFGRRSLALSHGDADDGRDTLLSARLTRDRGWRAHAASRLAQLFGRWALRRGDDDAHATLMLADNRLEGAQTLPQSFLDTPREAYTWPDINTNRLAMASAGVTRALDARHALSFTAYLRRTRSGNLSSNLNPELGSVDPVTGAVDVRQATNDAAQVRQTGGGLGLQLDADRRHAGLGHHLVLGASLDAGIARYEQRTQDAAITADRGSVGLGPVEPETDAQSRSSAVALYAVDAIALHPAWTMTLSLRHDRSRVSIADRSGTAPALDGRHVFARWNPALGVDWHPGPRWTAFASASQGLRAPTPMELTCADPQAPCKLPTGFVADPPLQPVVARTLEAGARGTQEGVAWSVAAWRTTLSDDIQFVASEAASAGYFRNVGRTRRQGLELSLRAQRGAWTGSLRLAHIDARVLQGYVERSPFHPAADAQGLIDVPAGARLPGIARHSATVRVEWSPNERSSVAASLAAQSSMLARGDEANRADAARVPGQGSVDLEARRSIGAHASLALRVHNLADRRIVNASALGRNAFAGPGRQLDGTQARNEPFFAPGAPRALWLTLTLQWP